MGCLFIWIPFTWHQWLYTRLMMLQTTLQSISISRTSILSTWSTCIPNTWQVLQSENCIFVHTIWGASRSGTEVTWSLANRWTSNRLRVQLKWNTVSRAEGCQGYSLSCWSRTTRCTTRCVTQPLTWVCVTSKTTMQIRLVVKELTMTLKALRCFQTMFNCLMCISKEH